MAYNPYFTFADPALQAQVVNEAQVMAAVQAAQAQQRAQTLAGMRQERQLQADKEERRAIREGDIRAREAATAEQRRQFGETIGFSEKELTSREKIAGLAETARERQERERAEAARYTAALRVLDRADADTLPTETEHETQIVAFSPEYKEGLRNARQARYRTLLRDFTLIDDEVGRLNAILDKKENDPKTGKPPTPDEVLSQTQIGRGNIRINPRTGRLEGLFKRPREDAPALTPRGPGGAAAPQLIGDIISGLARRAGAAVPGVLAAGEAEARRGFSPGNLLNLFAPGGIGAAPLAAGFYGGRPAPEAPVSPIFAPVQMPFEGSIFNPQPQPEPWIPAREYGRPFAPPFAPPGY